MIETNLQQRTPVYVIPIPCENEWCKNLVYFPSKLSEKANSREGSKRKRDRDEVLDYDENKIEDGVFSMYQYPLDDKNQVAAAMLGKKEFEVDKDLTKPDHPENNSNEESIHKIGQDLNYPVSNELGLPCLVKIYKNMDGIFLNSIVECIGIYTESPSDINRNLHKNEDQSIYFAPLAPRLHCILIQNLDEANPLISLNKNLENLKFTISNKSREIYTSLLNWIQQVLGGDRLLSEYVFLNMISKGANPNSSENKNLIGHIPINVTQCLNSHDSFPIISRLELISRTLMPKSHLISLSPEFLKNTNFVPFQNPENLRLETGCLQLSKGTHLIINETVLQEGTLKQDQLNKLNQLQNMISNQFVNYVFQNYSLPYTSNFPCIVTSEGKSLFGITLTIPQKCDVNIELPMPVDVDTLNQWRVYIGLCRQTDFPEYSNDVIEIAQNDFVKIRSESNNNYLTPELFSQWLSLARSTSILRGKNEITIEEWNCVKDLENERISRI